MSVPIPGPKPWPVIGNLLDIDTENSIQSFSKLCLEYGPIIKVTLSGTDIIFLSGHEVVHEICSHKDCVKLPAASIKELQAVTPEGLFTADPDQHSWHVAHRILVPAFGPLAIREMFQEMHDITSQLILKWARFGESNPIDVTSEFTRLTLDTIALCAMDTRINSFYEEKLHPFVAAMTSVLTECENRVVVPPWLRWLRRGANHKFDKDVQRLHEIAAEVVARRRAQPTKKKDLLNAMLHGIDPVTGERLNDQTIIDNMITFLVAGHETTSGLLSFSFALLLKHPDIYQKLQHEVDTVLGDGPATPGHISQLPYVKAVLRESLRLYPPSAGFPVAIQGNADEPFFLQGKYALKRNEAMFVLMPPLHRDASAYGDDVNEFRPERMLEENFNKLPPGCFKAFGSGMRACIGSEFAMQEAILATALLFQKFDFELVDPNYEITIKEALTLKPRDLFIYAKVRPGVSTLALPNDLFNRPGTPLHAETTKAVYRPLALRSERMDIYFGSSTGTCRGLAEQLAKAALQRGFNCTIQALDQAVDMIQADRPVVLITSTQHEGQPPENSAKYVEWLERVREGALSNQKVAVFGCGSSDWKSTHQKIAIHINKLLTQNGAQLMAPLGLTDVAQGNVLGDFDAWLSDEFWPGVQKAFPLETSEHIDQDPNELLHAIGDGSSCLQLKVLNVIELTTTADCQKYHMEIELPYSITYRLGDYLEVHPRNSPEDLVELFAYSRTRSLNASDALLHNIHGRLEFGQPASLKQIEVMQQACQSNDERNTLQELMQSLPHGSDRRPTIMQLLKMFPSICISLQQLISMLPPIRPRQYSISSSPHASPRSLSITWSLLTHRTSTPLLGHKSVPGLASHYLANLKKGDILNCTLRQGQPRFQPPNDPSVPMIMICAGTGLAPFRGFIQDRAQKIKLDPDLRNTLAPAVLYAGCRTPSDALYATEFQEWQASGAVDVRYSYSRLHPDTGPKYVQGLIWHDREHFKQLWKRGAKVLVCGSHGLSSGVKDTVRRIYTTYLEEENSDVDKIGLEEWWIDILRDRYITDIWG